MSDSKPKNWPSKNPGMPSGKGRDNNDPKPSESTNSQPTPKNDS